jgi:hypothetical protein
MRIVFQVEKVHGILATALSDRNRKDHGHSTLCREGQSVGDRLPAITVKPREDVRICDTFNWT